MQGSEEDEIDEDRRRFWQTRSEGRSQFIFIGFVGVTILMAIVVTATGAYGYYSWQEWRKGPQIRIEEGLFEFHEGDTPGEADIRVHITLINQRSKESGDITLEWLIMDSADSRDNIVLREGSKEINPMPAESTGEETFDISLGEGNYVISYRVYDDELFSYEARQNIYVGREDVEHDVPDTVTIPEYPFAFIPVILMILLICVFRRRYHDR